ncbi:hypothetical protein CELL_03207 [Cellulomonas sp. T2.31MG-18]|uniref:FRG domain-containing protein n=1 Tax=Cellulomonas sp. T2.31MG-18 TaxID=3157619 RepID=UPI0035ECBABC
MGPTPAKEWVSSGWGYRVANRDQLLRTISRISILKTGRIYAWRGQGSGEWNLSSSLYRSLERTGPVDESRMAVAEAKMIKAARKYGLGRELGASNTDANLLATLQHHGLPTRLIDVTSNPMTALWFATEPSGGDGEKPGVLFAIDVTDMPWSETIRHDAGVTWGGIERPLGYLYDSLLADSTQHRRPFRLFPALPDERMKAQEGFFVGSAVAPQPAIVRVPDLDFGDVKAPGVESLGRLAEGPDRGPGRPPVLPFLALVIPPRVKRALRDPLKGTYNRRRRVLFPDVDGFRDAYRHGEIRLES